MQIHAAEQGLEPEQVLVLETVGTIPEFIRAVRRIQGMEWLVEWEDDQLEPDDDFYNEDERGKPLSHRLFLVMSNQAALSELLAMWRARDQPFARGYANWRHLFEQLKDIRFWDERDRIDDDVLAYWNDRLAQRQSTIRFEIEIWHFKSEDKNQAAGREIAALVEELEGHVLSAALIPEIAYHAVLVELPAAAVSRIVRGDYPQLVLSARVMFFRPVTVAMSLPSSPEDVPLRGNERWAPSNGEPVVALLDGLPLQNHALLANRLVIDDPDGWAATYSAQDRVHGTAMASLIIHGEFGTQAAVSPRKLYVRPILRPDTSDVNVPRRERTPDDRLVIDLVHRAVRRIFEGESGEPPSAPSIRIVNLAVGDETRLFDRKLSPWARLVDWLAWRYGIMFCISSGNFGGSLELDVPRDRFAAMTLEEKQATVIRAMLDQHNNRRLIAPADAINAITVGGAHADSSRYVAVPDRFEPVPFGFPSPVSRVGHGFRRAIKPDVLAPCGRSLYRVRLGNVGPTTVDYVRVASPPGHRCASPGVGSVSVVSTSHSRGTSNATALTSRVASQIFEAIEQVRIGREGELPRSHDGVLLKAAVVHSAKWDGLVQPIIEARPDVAESRRQKDLIARWIGYGVLEEGRSLYCTPERATAVGVGSLSDGEALVFLFPLPPSLSGPRVYRRLAITLAWMSPSNNSHQAYRRARLWFQPPHAVLRVQRGMGSADFQAVQRGTVQHEVLQGEDASTFIDGESLAIKVNCAADAGRLEDTVKFGICVSLEVAAGIQVPVYQEVAARIRAPVRVRARTR